MIARIYTGSDGQSHFEELDFSIPTREPVAIKQGADLVFWRREPDTISEWHHPTRRQYVIVLPGRMEISIGDGSSRQLQTGDMLLAEDMTGQGHVTRSVDGPCLSVSVPRSTYNVDLSASFKMPGLTRSMLLPDTRIHSPNRIFVTGNGCS